MFLGGVAWSEVPISTLTEAVQSGSEVDFVGNVKTALSQQLQIKDGEYFDLLVKIALASTLQVKTSTSDSLTCKTQLDFSLGIGS